MLFIRVKTETDMQFQSWSFKVKEVALVFGPFPIHLYGENAHPVISL